MNHPDGYDALGAALSAAAFAAAVYFLAIQLQPTADAVTAYIGALQ